MALFGVVFVFLYSWLTKRRSKNEYVKAQTVLPEEIIELIQEYIYGEYLHIPRKSGNKKSCGEKNGTRKSLQKRNKESIASNRV